MRKSMDADIATVYKATICMLLSDVASYIQFSVCKSQAACKFNFSLLRIENFQNFPESIHQTP